MKLKHLLTVIPGGQTITIVTSSKTIYYEWEAINARSYLELDKENYLDYFVIRIESEKNNLKIYCIKN